VILHNEQVFQSTLRTLEKTWMNGQVLSHRKTRLEFVGKHAGFWRGKNDVVMRKRKRGYG
jgi:hypothetical protein